MDIFSLNIAQNKICFRRDPNSPEFVTSGNLKEFISDQAECGITITVFNKELPDNGSETELFSAPFMKEDENGIFVKKSDRFWSVCMRQPAIRQPACGDRQPAKKQELSGTGSEGKKIIRTYDPETDAVLCNLVITPGSPEWELFSSSEAVCANPFAYPLDGLILYYTLHSAYRLPVAGGQLPVAGILIHASAVEYEGRGYLFTGVSGKGKSTMAELWKEAGAVVIHDDLVVLTQHADGSILVSSTPMNGNISARQTRLDAIFLIGHADENVIDQIKGAEAFSKVLSNTIQHNYDSEIITRHLDNLMIILDSVPVYRMGFRPDRTIVEAIKDLEIVKDVKGGRGEWVEGENGGRGERVIAIETVKAVLESGNSVELSAAGYSMFPTLRPGDRVIIKPLAHGELPAKGTVVVFMDEGSTVQASSVASSLNLWNTESKKKEELTQRNAGGYTELHRGKGVGGCILVMHRVIEISDEKGEPVLITRGDSRKENDKPWPLDKFMGIAVSYKRGMTVYPVKTFVPVELRYTFCRLWLWVVLQWRKGVKA